jgi:hypothetical protein
MMGGAEQLSTGFGTGPAAGVSSVCMPGQDWQDKESKMAFEKLWKC